MSAVAVPARAQEPIRSPRDRRSHNRYPIELELEYKLWNSDRVERVGFGRTLNLSSGGVLFEADVALPAGAAITLAVKWPCSLGKACTLKLHMRGRVIRCEARRIAVELTHYEFRTAGSRSAAAQSAS